MWLQSVNILNGFYLLMNLIVKLKGEYCFSFINERVNSSGLIIQRKNLVHKQIKTGSMLIKSMYFY